MAFGYDDKLRQQSILIRTQRPSQPQPAYLYSFQSMLSQQSIQGASPVIPEQPSVVSAPIPQPSQPVVQEQIAEPEDKVGDDILKAQEAANRPATRMSFFLYNPSEAISSLALRTGSYIDEGLRAAYSTDKRIKNVPQLFGGITQSDITALENEKVTQFAYQFRKNPTAAFVENTLKGGFEYGILAMSKGIGALPNTAKNVVAVGGAGLAVKGAADIIEGQTMKAAGDSSYGVQRTVQGGLEIIAGVSLASPLIKPTVNAIKNTASNSLAIIERKLPDNPIGSVKEFVKPKPYIIKLGKYTTENTKTPLKINIDEFGNRIVEVSESRKITNPEVVRIDRGLFGIGKRVTTLEKPSVYSEKITKTAFISPKEGIADIKIRGGAMRLTGQKIETGYLIEKPTDVNIGAGNLMNRRMLFKNPNTINTMKTNIIKKDIRINMGQNGGDNILNIRPTQGGTSSSPAAKIEPKIIKASELFPKEDTNIPAAGSGRLMQILKPVEKNAENFFKPVVRQIQKDINIFEKKLDLLGAFPAKSIGGIKPLFVPSYNRFTLPSSQKKAGITELDKPTQKEIPIQTPQEKIFLRDLITTTAITGFASSTILKQNDITETRNIFIQQPAQKIRTNPSRRLMPSTGGDFMPRKFSFGFIPKLRKTKYAPSIGGILSKKRFKRPRINTGVGIRSPI